MSKTTIVHLRVIKGNKVSYDVNGDIQNENQIVKLQHGVLEWVNYMKNLHRNGFCEVHAEKVVELGEKGEKDKEVDVKAIEAEVQAIMRPISKAKISVEDELAELKVAMQKLQEGNVKTDTVVDATPVDKVDSTPDINEELEIARKKVHEITGKKPHHMTQLKTLNDIIEDNK